MFKPQNLPFTLGKFAIALVASALVLSSTPQVMAAAGDLYVTELATGSVVRYASDGTPTTFATGLTSPQGIVFDQAKNLYVADAGDGLAGSGTITKYDPNGVATVFRSGLDNPSGLALDGSDLLVSENGADRVLRIPLDGKPPSILQIITGPLGVVSKAFGGTQSGFFRYIAAGPIVREIAPPSGTVQDFDFSADPSRNVAVDDSGNLFVTTDGGNVIEIPVGTTTQETFASGFVMPTGMDFRPAKFAGDTDRVGFLYVANTGADEIVQIAGDGTQSTFVTGAGSPNYIVFETNAPVQFGKALNISTRVDVETGENVGIGGFIITGTDPKQVVIRAIGPSLTDFGVDDALSDPTLELRDSGGVLVASNDNWMDNSDADQTFLTDNGLAPTNDLESALVATLDPGAYTGVVSGVGGATGIALIEAYDLDDPLVEGELANISTRGLVGTDANVLIGGIIVGPTGALDASIVVRAIGPSLADSGVANPLIDPVVELRNEMGDIIAMNDNWQTDPEPDNYADEVTAAALAPTEDAEAAIFANLVPGLYTAIVSGKDGTVGVGLVEVYHVSPLAP